MNLKHDVRAAARRFQIAGEFLSAVPCGSGHINDTYCAVFDQGGARVRYILQRINHHVFKNQTALMENIRRVTEHLAAKTAGEPDGLCRALTLIPARDGRSFHHDEQGNFWRAYIFIDRAIRNEPITIYGDREQTRDFIYVKAVVAANVFFAARSPATGVFNVASGRRITVNDLAQTICRLTGSRSEIKRAAERPGDVKHSLAGMDQTRAAGFTPADHFSEGLAATIGFFKK